MVAALDSVDSQIASNELVSLDLEKARSETFRERLARHIVGEEPCSNFEAMVQAMASDLEPCPDCEGLGSRLLPRPVLDEYAAKIKTRQDECQLLAAQIDEAEAGERTKLGQSEPEERERRQRTDHTQQLIKRLADTKENIRKLRRELNRRGICRSCEGSSFAPRRRRSQEGDPGRPDSMWTTVTCPGCQGKDARSPKDYPKLMTTHRGSSCGEVRMRGSRLVDGSVVSDPKDDRAAERQDVCELCKGLAYRVPMSVRPALKTSNVYEDPNGVDELPDGFPASDFDQSPEDPSDPASFLQALEKEDPTLASAVAVLHTEHAKTWARHAWGRHFALVPLTDSGRGGGAGARGYEQALEQCASRRLANAQEGTGGIAVRSLVSWSDTAARALLMRAERAIQQASLQANS